MSTTDTPGKVATLLEQGMHYYTKFVVQRNLDDLELTITNIGLLLRARFNQRDSIDDLENAISNARNAIDLTPDGHAEQPARLNNLGGALKTRFDRYGPTVELEESISNFRKAVDLTPDGDPAKLKYLINLGDALCKHYGRNASFDDLRDSISNFRKAVDLALDSHPARPDYLNNLENALGRREPDTASQEDVDNSIANLQAGAWLTLEDDFDRLQVCKDILIEFETFINRPGSLDCLIRAIPSKKTSIGDIPDGIMNLVCGAPGIDVEDSIVNLRTALQCDPEDHPGRPRLLNDLGVTLERRYSRRGCLEDMTEAISRKEEAVNLVPDGHPDRPMFLNSLSMSLQKRFYVQGSFVDLEDAIIRQRMAVFLLPEGHPDKPDYLTCLGDALETRYDRYRSFKDLEDAILIKRMAVYLTPDGYIAKQCHLNSLGIALQRRFERQGSIIDLEDAILIQRKVIDLIPDGYPVQPGYFSNLGSALEKRFNRHGSLDDLEEAIFNTELSVELTSDGHPDKPRRLNNLYTALQARFKQHSSLYDLQDAVLSSRKAVALTPNGHPNKLASLVNLSRALRQRFELLGEQEDLQQALLAAQESAESIVGSSPLRFQSARLWADCCMSASTSPLPAFKCAIELLPRLAWLGLAVDDQYALLAEAGDTVRDAVAAAIAEQEYETAMRWAEQGRSVVWQNLLRLRTPLDGLRMEHPSLAARLEEISRRLEQPLETISEQEESRPTYGASNQMALAMEWDTLVEEVRKIPGFESFVNTKSLEELVPAMSTEPAILLNLSKFRCDALALLVDSHGSVSAVPIPLNRVTLQKAEQLSKALVDLLHSIGVGSRKLRRSNIGGSTGNKEVLFKDILRILWLDYVKPIIGELKYKVNLDSPPRLWWCTTGPLTFLPLHAAGAYDAKEDGHKLSDYVISSYTPTLTGLLENSLPVSAKEFKVLAVAISNTPEAPLPSTEKEVKLLRRLADNLPVTSLTNEEATKEHVLKELEQSSWAHLACHGEQVGGKPMESGLLLHDGKLKLSGIVKMQLLQVEFAFLSACQTTVGDGGVPEESAHLAAGMLFAGYRGVVATMWSIRDDVAPRVAEEFYRHMFRNGKPDGKEAACALHKALRSMHASGVSFASWVPFIHMGR